MERLFDDLGNMKSYPHHTETQELIRAMLFKYDQSDVLRYLVKQCEIITYEENVRHSMNGWK